MKFTFELTFAAALLMTACGGQGNPAEHAVAPVQTAVIPTSSASVAQSAAAPAATEPKPQPAKEAEGAKEPAIVNGMGVVVETPGGVLESSAFTIRGVPPKYQVFSSISDGTDSTWLFTDANGDHVATLVEVAWKVDRSKPPAKPKLDAKKIKRENLTKFEPQSPSSGPPQTKTGPGKRTQFGSRYYSYELKTMGSEAWILEGFEFKDPSMFLCSAETEGSCPARVCECQGKLVQGDAMKCVSGLCSEKSLPSCKDFCATVDVNEKK
jgi:hypothetical protein